MKELIITVAKALVDNPDQVEVNLKETEDGTVYELKVAPADLGKVIGKKGRTAKAIRTLLAAGSMKSGARARLKILEEDDEIGQIQSAVSPADNAAAISEVDQEPQASSEIDQQPEASSEADQEPKASNEVGE